MDDRRGSGSTGTATIEPILVVDSSPEWLELVTHFLSEAGFPVVACRSAQELRSIFDRTDPDVVIVGSKLADATSMAVCRWLRERSSVAILVFDERTDIGSAPLLESGADAVVVTTIGPNELVARVRALLRRVPPRRR